MWTSQIQNLSDNVFKFSMEFKSAPAAFAAVLRAWQHDAECRSLIIELLSDVPFNAFRWETPPITTSTVNRPFEFVVLNSPGLDRTPDPSAFQEHFGDTSTADVTAFANLGNDAVLVVPFPKGPAAAYGHLAAFVRHAPEQQKHALLSLVGSTVARRLKSAPIWLSTAGAGVPWLHVRIDDRPKYYGHTPYTRCNFDV